MLESIAAQEQRPRWLPRVKTLHDLAKTGIVEITAPKEEQRANGTRYAGAQQVGYRRISEATGAVFFEDSLARQQAQGAVQRTFMHLQLVGKFGRGAPFFLEQICHTQAGYRIQSLMENQSVSRAQEDRRDRRGRGLLRHAFSLT